MHQILYRLHCLIGSPNASLSWMPWTRKSVMKCSSGVYTNTRVSEHMKPNDTMCAVFSIYSIICMIYMPMWH